MRNSKENVRRSIKNIKSCSVNKLEREKELKESEMRRSLRERKFEENYCCKKSDWNKRRRTERTKQRIGLRNIRLMNTCTESWRRSMRKRSKLNLRKRRKNSKNFENFTNLLIQPNFQSMQSNMKNLRLKRASQLSIHKLSNLHKCTNQKCIDF